MLAMVMGLTTLVGFDAAANRFTARRVLVVLHD